MRICTEHSFELMRRIEDCSDVLSQTHNEKPTDVCVPHGVFVKLEEDGSMTWTTYQLCHIIVSNDEFVRHCARMKPKTETKVHDYRAFAIGDEVMVVAKAKDKEGGWREYWEERMDFFVGKLCIITDIHGLNGFELEVISGDDESHLFPSFVIRKVSK